MSRVITRSFYVLIVVAASSDFCFWRELVHRIRIRLIRSLNHLITILLLWFRTFVRNFDSLDSFLASEVPNRVSSRLRASTGAQMTVRIGNVQKCWEKRASTQHERGDFCPRPCRVTVKRGDNLVVVDFFSPGCDGCKALNPKICQLTEMNPDVQILQVNYEEHKSINSAIITINRFDASKFPIRFDGQIHGFNNHQCHCWRRALSDRDGPLTLFH
ncbi:Thioredoxin-like 1-1 [Vigna angularis]|uniref:Thioredoxin-like 1-1 n=1 Tax=Phaseolus angularis TaxID=3914 RepID=A0A8T0LAW0_PHAAN|nr:Thioredoxin-like 1-1 [Vigna angularis]